MFSSDRGRSLSPDRLQTSHSPKRGLFGRRNSSGSSHDSLEHRTSGSVKSGGSRNGGFLGIGGRGHDDLDRDPTILSARQKVREAEEAEREADRALIQARGMVKEAREHVKILEREAIEE